MAADTQPDGKALFSLLAQAEQDLLTVARAVTRGTGAKSADNAGPTTAGRGDAITSRIDSLIGRLRGLVALDFPADARRAKVAPPSRGGNSHG
jgi:hypothetical protein